MARRSFNIRRILTVATVAITILLCVAWQQGLFSSSGGHPPSNSLMVIMPYRHAGTWVFDDAAMGLKQEPFVGGIPDLIDEMVKDIPEAESGFRLLFSAQPFPEYTDKLIWRRGDEAGNWYYSERYDKEGWLCPALFKYYKAAPQEIFVKAEQK